MPIHSDAQRAFGSLRKAHARFDRALGNGEFGQLDEHASGFSLCCSHLREISSLAGGHFTPATAEKIKQYLAHAAVLEAHVLTGRDFARAARRFDAASRRGEALKEFEEYRLLAELQAALRTAIRESERRLGLKPIE